MKEIDTKFLWDGEDTMSMDAGNEFAGHVERAELIIFVTTSRAKTAVTTKRNKFKVATVGTTVHGATVRRVTTMNHLVDIFNDSRTWMEFVNHMFIIISKDGL